MSRAKTNGTQNGVKKWNALHKEEIRAQGHMTMMFEDGSRDHHGNKSWCTGSRSRTSGFAFEDGNIRAVNDYGSLGVVRSNWAVADEVSLEDVNKLCLIGATNLAIQLTGGISRFYFTSREESLLFGYSGDHSVGGNTVVSIIKLVDI